ncbi:hypothetical protein COX09_05185, partial [Candidatus Beckwithbacteria bacterium CG23_combo_of_CG06-09_8_20_14_all_47_9]
GLNPAGLLFSIFWLIALIMPRSVVEKLIKTVNEMNGVQSKITDKTINYYRIFSLIAAIIGLSLAYIS